MTNPAGPSADDATPSSSVEKLMTLSQSEFAKSIAAFAGADAGAVALQGAPVELSAGPGQVQITFEKVAGFSFGGLVEMPRARVVIQFRAVPAADQAVFMRRFDIAFQRGGG